MHDDDMDRVVLSKPLSDDGQSGWHDLPNNGWGDPPKYDWLSFLVWAGLLVGSILAWALIIYGAIALVKAVKG
jgi:hypothetical protein